MPRKPTNRLFIVLLLLLIAGITISLLKWEYISNLFRKRPPENTTRVVEQSNEHITIAIPADSIKNPVDTGMGITRAQHDSTNIAKKKNYTKDNGKDDQSIDAALQANALSMTSANASTSVTVKYRAIPSISPDVSMVAKKVNTETGTSLMFYPIAGWNETFIILPANISNHHKLGDLLYRDYSGVVYPSRKKVQVVVNGVTQSAELIRLKGPQPSEGYPEYVVLNSSPAFIIFGDYWNSDKWYLYQSNKISRFAPNGLSSLDSLK